LVIALSSAILTCQSTALSSAQAAKPRVDATLRVEGDVSTPLTLTATDITNLPRTTTTMGEGAALEKYDVCLSPKARDHSVSWHPTINAERDPSGCSRRWRLSACGSNQSIRFIVSLAHRLFG
jgi:hypothetical protein